MPIRKSLFFLLLFSTLCASGQDLPSDSALSRVLKSDVLLQLLIDSATRNSPEIQRSQHGVALMEQNYQASKKSLLNSISLSTGYGYGNSGSISIDKDLLGLGQANTFNNIRSSRYSVGVNLSLPLGNFLSRKNVTRTAELQIAIAESEQKNVALQVRQKVITLYQDLKLAHALLVSTSRVRQSAFINLNMARKNFLDGQMPVEQFTKQQNEYSQTEMDCQTKQNAFQTSFLLLETFTGVNLASLIQRLR